MLNVSQEELAAYANMWEPEASSSRPVRRASRCAVCGGRVWRPWHIWLSDAGFKKELHVHDRCVRRLGWNKPRPDQPLNGMYWSRADDRAGRSPEWD